MSGGGGFDDWFEDLNECANASITFELSFGNQDQKTFKPYDVTQLKPKAKETPLESVTKFLQGFDINPRPSTTNSKSAIFECHSAANVMTAFWVLLGKEKFIQKIKSLFKITDPYFVVCAFSLISHKIKISEYLGKASTKNYCTTG